MRRSKFMSDGERQNEKGHAYMSDNMELSPGDRAITKIGRNLVEVRVKAKTVGGWTVTTRTGRDITVRNLEHIAGAAADATAKAAPAKTATAAPAPKPATATVSSKAVPQKGLGLLSAAAVVLERSDAPMTVKAMIEGAKDAGLWSPKGGKTPEQTLYSAIIREIRDKGAESRFRKDGRGLFAFAR